MNAHRLKKMVNALTAIVVMAGCLALLALPAYAKKNAAVEHEPVNLSLTAYYPFDGKANDVTDPTAKPAHINSKDPVKYVDGVTGKAIEVSLHSARKITFRHGVINRKSGTVMMWLKHGEALDSMWGMGVLFSKLPGKEFPMLLWSHHTFQWLADTTDAENNASRSLHAQPNHNEWIHLAVTWDEQKNEQCLYLNGKLDGPYARVKLNDTKISLGDTVSFSVFWGSEKRSYAIDEFKIYSRALTQAEIQAAVNKVAPVQVDFVRAGADKRALRGKPGEVKDFVGLVRTRVEHKQKAKLLLETLDGSDNRLWSKIEEISLSPRRKPRKLHWQVPIADKSQAAYIKASLLDRPARPSWSIKIMRVADTPLDQDAKMTAHRVASIDCAANSDTNLFYCNHPTKIVETAFGKYRETAPENFAYFCYRFNVQHPGKLHVMQLTYPNDKNRIMALDINDGSGRSPQGAGVQSGFMSRISDEMRVQSVFFRPVTTNCLLTVCNWGSAGNNNGSIVRFVGENAALAKFEVLELNLERLPKLTLPQALPGKTRTVGMWVEDASQTGFWGAPRTGINPLDAWVISVENMVEYMNYIGVNVYQYPIVWYSGSLFPCKTMDAFNYPCDRTAGHPDGCFDMLLSIFARDGMQFYPSFYVRDIAALYFQANENLHEKFKRHVSKNRWPQRYRGAHPGGDDIFQIYRNGKHRTEAYGTNHMPGGYSVGPVFNPIHPDVMKIVKGTVNDWLELYGDNPGLGGMTLDLGATWGGLPQIDSLSFDRLNTGYGDFTIAQFKQDTGIDVPGEPGSPLRFEVRYSFLTSGAMREKWIAWRCQQIHDKVVMPIYKTMRKHRKDLKLDIIIGSRKWVGSPLTGAEISWQDAARECGIDVNLYKDVSGINIIRHGSSSQNLTKCYPVDNLDDSWPAGQPGQSGVTSITSSYWEMFSHKKILDPVRKMWPAVKANQMPVRTITDAGMGVLGHTAYAIMKKDIASVYIGGMGNPATFGHEKEMRQFVRAFRSLPPVAFDDVAGMEDPVRMRTKTIKGRNWFYMVNAEPYPIKVSLKFSDKPGNVIDLGRNRKLKINSKHASLTLKPYEFRSFKITDSRAKLMGGTAHVPPQEVTDLQARLDKCAEQKQKILDMHGAQKPGQHYLWFEAEDWDSWKTKERLGKNHLPFKKPQDVIISGADYIAFGGGGIPVSYNLRVPQAGKYSLWVKFVTPERNKGLSNWRASIDGKEVGIIKTPAADEKLWVKIGEAELAAGTVKMNFAHKTPAYSTTVDSFLLTSDPAYVPNGPADYSKRKADFHKNFNPAKTALKRRHTARARAIITALENVN